MIDITVARLTHLNWELQLELALKRKRDIIKLESFDNCELGSWLYNSAIETYKEISEIHLIEREHK